MSLPLTKEMLQAAYDYLATTPPFSGWNMPSSDDVRFKVGRDPRRCGWYRWNGQQHEITISTACVGRTESVMSTMAHEMIHVFEEHVGACGKGEHSRAFKRWAAEVCQHHGFDPKMF